MNTNKAVANEVAAPATSYVAAPAAGEAAARARANSPRVLVVQDLMVFLWPHLPGRLPKEYSLARYSKIPSSPVVAGSGAGSPGVVGSRTTSSVTFGLGYLPPRGVERWPDPYKQYRPVT